MYPNIENKTVLGDINKPNISPKTTTETQVIELLKVIYPMRTPFIHVFTTMRSSLFLVVQNTIQRKTKAMKAIEIEFAQKMQA